MCIKFVTPSGPHTTCCPREQAVRVFRIPVTSSLSNCSHVTLFGQQHSKECFFFHVEVPSASFYHCHGELSSSPFFFQLMLWCCLHPMMHGTNVFYHCIMQRARPGCCQWRKRGRDFAHCHALAGTRGSGLPESESSFKQRKMCAPLQVAKLQ